LDNSSVDIMETLKIKIKDIPSSGLTESLQVAARDLALEDTGDIHFNDPVKVDFNLEKVSDMVLADVKVTAKFSTICGRCLEEVQQELKEDLELNFSINPRDEFIDLTEDIRQEMVLDMPVRVLCKQDCKGLCVHCGANLNTEKCQCENKSDYTDLKS